MADPEQSRQPSNMCQCINQVYSDCPHQDVKRKLNCTQSFSVTANGIKYGCRGKKAVTIKGKCKDCSLMDTLATEATTDVIADDKLMGAIVELKENLKEIRSKREIKVVEREVDAADIEAEQLEEELLEREARKMVEERETRRPMNLWESGFFGGRPQFE